MNIVCVCLVSFFLIEGCIFLASYLNGRVIRDHLLDSKKGIVQLMLPSMALMFCLFAFVTVTGWHRFFEDIPDDGLFPIGVGAVRELLDGIPPSDLRIEFARKHDRILFVGHDNRTEGKRVVVSLSRHPFEIDICEGSVCATAPK